MPLTTYYGNIPCTRLRSTNSGRIEYPSRHCIAPDRELFLLQSQDFHPDKSPYWDWNLFDINPLSVPDVTASGRGFSTAWRENMHAIHRENPLGCTMHVKTSQPFPKRPSRPCRTSMASSGADYSYRLTYTLLLFFMPTTACEVLKWESIEIIPRSVQTRQSRSTKPMR